jgi:5-hydroxyisourate hydrolase-like protein (transthyretin family)
MKKLTMIIFAAALFSSCEKETEQTSTAPETIQVQVKVLDYVTGNPIDSVAVEMYYDLISGTTTPASMGHTDQQGQLSCMSGVNSLFGVSKRGFYAQKQDDKNLFQKKDNLYTFYLLAEDKVDFSFISTATEPILSNTYSVRVTGILRDGSTRFDEASNKSIRVGANSNTVPLKIFKGIENKVEVLNLAGSVVKTVTIPATRTSNSLALEI